MAKNTGKVFEEQFASSVETPQCYVYRVKDAASSFNQTEESGLRFSVSNDYDFMLYRFPHYFPLELKSSTTASFSFQSELKEKGKQIKQNQIKGLTKASLTHGVFAGFMFNLSTTNKTYWLDIKDFNRFLSETTKKSINETDIISYGGLLIDQRLKKVKYAYNITKLLDDIVERGELAL